jgi:hypothetical protein
VQKMIETLMLRNLQEVFGEGDPTRRTAAVAGLYTGALFSCRSAATLDGMRWIASRANCARDIQTSSMRRIVPHRLFRTQGESHGASRAEPRQSELLAARSLRATSSCRIRSSSCQEAFPLALCQLQSRKTTAKRRHHDQREHPATASRHLTARDPDRSGLSGSDQQGWPGSH